MEKNHKGLEDLRTWQKARAVMLFVHKQIVPLLPAEEKWDLADQVRRASKSIMANIAEGHGRFYYQETVRFCYIARGSLEETLSHLITARDLGYIPDSLYEQGKALTQETLITLNGYIAYLRRAKRGGDRPPTHTRELSSPYLSSEETPELQPNHDSPLTNHQSPITNHQSPITNHSYGE